MLRTSLFLSAVVFFPSPVAYEVSTHRRLGDLAALESVGWRQALQTHEWDELSLGGPEIDRVNLALSRVEEPILRMTRPADILAAGCCTEDAKVFSNPSTYRFLNHFLDGVDFTGFDGVSYLNGEPSDVWAHNYAGNAFNWARANEYYTQALTSEDPQDRENAQVLLFRSLGQVLHLIQDAHQPSHTRNDSHSNHGLGDGKSELELWAKEHVTLTSVDATVRAALATVPQYYKPTIVEYVRDAAATSARDFFSDDTIWHNGVQDYVFPNDNDVVESDIVVLGERDTYLVSGLNHLFHGILMARRRNGFFDAASAALGVGSDTWVFESPDDVVARSQAAVLLPRAVAKCTGALNHFFRFRIDASIAGPALVVSNASAAQGATAGDLLLAGGATLTAYYETVSGRVLPVGMAAWTLPALGVGQEASMVVDLVTIMNGLADETTNPDPNVRAREDRLVILHVEGTVGQEMTQAAARINVESCPVGYSTPPGMVAIPAGTFMMGSNVASGAPYYGNSGEQPVHEVTISACFWMGEHEVTQAEYQALTGSNPSLFQGAALPVERVSWYDAQSYCIALTAQQAAQGQVPPGYEYRLPTEAEWEYACRAGTTTPFHYGPELFCGEARFSYSFHSTLSCNQSGTGPVGSYAPNAFGLYDMHGNVWEWCLDSYAAYAAGSQVDPFVNIGSNRVIRGGSWIYFSYYCRSALRLNRGPSAALEDVGFRVVLAPVLAP